MKEKTVAAIVLDKSGSMARTASQTVTGFNEYVQQIKQNAADIPTEVCLVTFNAEVYEHLWLEPVEKLAEAQPGEYVAQGSTAFYDALNYTINKLQKTGYDDTTTSYLIIVISDGEENASLHTNIAALREQIQGCDTKENWTITYMGCDKNYLKKLAKDTGIPLSNMAAWSNESAAQATYGYSSSAGKVGKFMQSRTSGIRGQSCNFYSADASQSADFAEIDKSVDVYKNPPDVNINMFIPPVATPTFGIVQNCVQAQVMTGGMHVQGTTSEGVFRSNSPVTWE
jgi:uncharacterized protein YegL